MHEIPNGVIKICIYVASDPILVRVAFKTPESEKHSFERDHLLTSGLNVHCICKYVNFGRCVRQPILITQKVRLIKLKSAEPEIYTVLALDFHEPLTLQLIAKAQLSTLRLSEKQFRDYYFSVAKKRLQQSTPALAGSDNDIALACSVSKIQRIFLTFNLLGLQRTCACAVLLHDPHSQFINRLDLDEYKNISRLRRSLLIPSRFDRSLEKYPSAFTVTRKFPYLTSPVFSTNPRKVKR